MMVSSHSATPAVVLVVEDEMLLRMRAVDMVEDAGFISLEAVDADQAIGILESRSDIALLFTDIQMPGRMDGLKLAHPSRALAANQDHPGVGAGLADRYSADSHFLKALRSSANDRRDTTPDRRGRPPEPYRHAGKINCC